jgi:CBS domain-containing protein
VSQLVRDAMVPEPLALEADRPAREAGQALARPDVRVVFVVSERRLVGAVTRKTLVREIVAAGRDPEATLLGEIAEQPNHTIACAMPLDQAFAELEELDLERVPVVDDGRLVGVLSRSVVQRRLAEDEPPPDLED